MLGIWGQLSPAIFWLDGQKTITLYYRGRVYDRLNSHPIYAGYTERQLSPTIIRVDEVIGSTLTGYTLGRREYDGGIPYPILHGWMG